MSLAVIRSIARVALVAVMVILVGALAAACGDGGGELTLEEFFRELEAIDDEFEAEAAALEPQFQVLTADTTVAEVLPLLRAQSDLIEGFVDEIEDLKAPEEAQAIQDEAVIAGREVVETFDGLMEGAENVGTLEELITIFDEDAAFTAADDRFTQACLDAEQLAADNSITVDLNCNDE